MIYNFDILKCPVIDTFTLRDEDIEKESIYLLINKTPEFFRS